MLCKALGQGITQRWSFLYSAEAANRTAPGRRPALGSVFNSAISRDENSLSLFAHSSTVAPASTLRRVSLFRSLARCLFCSCLMRALTALRCSIRRFSLLIRVPCTFMLPTQAVSDKIFSRLLSRHALPGACIDVAGESFLLKKTQRHYSEWRGKSTSIFLIPMAASTGWTERPKGALTQTSFAVRQESRFLHDGKGRCRPLDSRPPAADRAAEPSCRFVPRMRRA